MTWLIPKLAPDATLQINRMRCQDIGNSFTKHVCFYLLGVILLDLDIDKFLRHWTVLRTLVFLFIRRNFIRFRQHFPSIKKKCGPFPVRDLDLNDIMTNAIPPG